MMNIRFLLQGTLGWEASQYRKIIYEKNCERYESAKPSSEFYATIARWHAKSESQVES